MAGARKQRASDLDHLGSSSPPKNFFRKENCSDYDIGLVHDRIGLSSDEEKWDFIQNVWKPALSFDFPRSCHFLEVRRFSHSWLHLYDWLVYSKYVDGAFCLPCVCFGSTPGSPGYGRPCLQAVKLDKLFRSPLRNWKRATVLLRAHDSGRSPTHSFSVRAMRYFCQSMTDDSANHAAGLRSVVSATGSQPRQQDEPRVAAVADRDIARQDLRVNIMAAETPTFPIKNEKGLRVSALNPKYLHTNSTSHTWPFSAVAELIDNAYDPDVSASQLWIDLSSYNSLPALTFTDNGNGMDPAGLYKMLSFGFCEKVAVKGHMPVGHYGNGFKSGSMRLGKDALVFTKRADSHSIGFLSQSYLEGTEAETIVVPILQWNIAKNTFVDEEGANNALDMIFQYSVVKSKQRIAEEFKAIPGSSGTRIILFNLRKAGEKATEFDFLTDARDILIPSDSDSLAAISFKEEQRQHHIPASDYSLRAYCSILYLKPKMQIILRGQKVKTCVIAKSLSKTEIDIYRPTGTGKPVKIVFGFSQNRNHYGIMMYHRNRLIKPYVRVGYQMRANNLGVGVIGVIECDYLQPTHNKQDFDYTESYRTCMASLGTKLNEYWTEKKQATKTKTTATSDSNGDSPAETTTTADDDVIIVPDELWVQCDNPKCLKWRKMPPGSDANKLPEKWFCSQHPVKQWKSCAAPEEPYWGEDNEVKPYIKEVKRKMAKERELKKIATVKKKEEVEKNDRDKLKQLQKDLHASTQKALSVAASMVTKKVQSVQPLSSVQRLNGSPTVAAVNAAVVNAASAAAAAKRSGPVLMQVKPSGSQLFSSALANGAMRIGKPFDVKTSSGKSAKLLYIATPQQLTSAGGNVGGVTLKPINLANQNVLYTAKSHASSGAVGNLATVLTGTSGVQTLFLNSPPSSTAVPGGPARQMFIINQAGSRTTPAVLPPSDGSPLANMNKQLSQIGVVAAQNRIMTSTQVHSAAAGVVLQLPSPAVPLSSTVMPLRSTSFPGSTAATTVVAATQLVPSVVAPSSKGEATAASLTVPSMAADAVPTIPPKSNRNNDVTAASESPVTCDSAPSTPERSKRRGQPVTPTILRRSKRAKLDESSPKVDTPGASVPVNGTVSHDVGIVDKLEDYAADKDIIDEVTSNPASSYRGKLIKRSQQLRDLRKSVCGLLAILVPDLTLPDLENKSLDDDTLDALLKQVLDANAEDTS